MQSGIRSEEMKSGETLTSDAATKVGIRLIN